MASEACERFMVDAGDGRELEVLATSGTGLPLLFHTGTPAGLVPYRPLLENSAGLRCVFYSRPGYGSSSPLPGRTVASAATDVAAILDHLGIDQFVTAGWSGGGPHALASAALLPGRCLAVTTIAGVAPRFARGLDWLAGMGQENLDEFAATMAGVAELTALLTEAAALLGELTAAEVADSLGGLVTEADRAVLTGEFAGYLARATGAAVATGIAGWRDDDLAFVSDWGFSLDEVRAPVSVWQGDQDAMVPLGHGQWLARHFTGARAHLLPGEGHLSLVAHHLDAILSELTEAASQA